MPVDRFRTFAEAELKHFSNTNRKDEPTDLSTNHSLFSPADLKRSFNTISQWPAYEPTPLIALNGLAQALNVAQIHIKDEGGRFGLGSFKALGGAYAVSELLKGQSVDPSTVTVTSATDGNHGLSVAWGAKTHGCKCVIFIHAEVSPGREEALKSQGAKVIRISGNYDDSVSECYAAAEESNWIVVSDTARDDTGSDIAKIVMSGYSVMATEIVSDLADEIPTHVFIQGGVGGLAATICEIFRLAWNTNTPRFVVVEPDLAPCLFESAKAGQRTAVSVCEETVMAGLSCGEVSYIAWPTLHKYADDFLTIPDSVVAPTMRLLAEGPFDDPRIIAGESAVAGLAGFICARQHESQSGALQIAGESRVLAIGTEGATDPALYSAMTGCTADSLQRAKICPRP